MITEFNMHEQWWNKYGKDNNPWKNKQCISPSHNPPTHLCIPPGETKTHTCPCCGQTTIMHGGPIIICQSAVECCNAG